MKIVEATSRVDRPVTEAVLDEAIKRGQVSRSNGAVATAVRLKDECLVISFEDGSGVSLPLGDYPEFEHFEVDDFIHLKVSHGGTALCHERRDLQVSIAGMIMASKSLMAMAALVIASRNGRKSSAAKSEAARVNGKKGGRPRKAEIAP